MSACYNQSFKMSINVTHAFISLAKVYSAVQDIAGRNEKGKKEHPTT
jgi:hypothetical protein